MKKDEEAVRGNPPASGWGLTGVEIKQLLLRLSRADRRGCGMHLSAREASQLAWVFSVMISDVKADLARQKAKRRSR